MQSALLINVTFIPQKHSERWGDTSENFNWLQTLVFYPCHPNFHCDLSESCRLFPAGLGSFSFGGYGGIIRKETFWIGAEQLAGSARPLLRFSPALSRDPTARLDALLQFCAIDVGGVPDD